MRGVVLVSLAVIVVAGSFRLSAGLETVKVDGGQVAGVEVGGVRVFKGIPFAAPPVGDLRWKPPEPVVPWTGVRKADAFGPQCMQLPLPTGSPYASDPAPMSEDCLYLNVWTSAGANEKRPVMMWIYGGGWTIGAASAASDGVFIYDGAMLARKGVVVVTPNYRLGALGFLAYPELTAESPHHSSGNYAILDHIAALQWVRKNISAFGGDPANVAIFGESAGSASVNVTQATPLARGMFHKAIGESAARFWPFTPTGPFTPTLGQAEQRGVALARAVGADSLKALRSVPAEKLVAVRSFVPSITVDDWVLPADVRTIFAQKKQSAVPVLVGSNADEWTLLAAAFDTAFPTTMEGFHQRVDAQFPGLAKEFDEVYPVKSTDDIAPALMHVGRDNGLTLQMRTWARMVTAAGRKAFLYQFTRIPQSPNANAWGAFHAAEIPYVFGNLRFPTVTYTETDRSLSATMSSYWVNFAKTGDPNGKGLPRWAAYDPDSEPYLDLGDPVQLKHHLLKAQLDFLERAQNARLSTSR